MTDPHHPAGPHTAGPHNADPLPLTSLTDRQLSGAVEALLLMAEEPIAAVTLAEAVREPLERVTATLQELRDFYDRTERGFELRHVGGGWRYYTRAEHADLIGRWLVDGRHAGLSQAALETLAVIAYLQPISRSRVAAVRGVSVDGVIRTLTARGLIAESGTDEHSGAMLFATTPLFCEKMGLASLADLPPLAPHLPDALDLEAELAREAAFASDAPAGDSTTDNSTTEETHD
ncbi:MAG TPA: SMC-Scp complex subunit ScpB [Propionibacterium sp.]|nr:SMC-Scp complex subunit ScpB [Propionibacterium sp.]